MDPSTDSPDRPAYDWDGMTESDDPPCCTIATAERMLRRKCLAGAAMLRTAIRACQLAYGDEAVDVVRDAMIARSIELGAASRQQLGDLSLEELCQHFENGWRGTHAFERVHEGPDHVEYRITRCIWADVFRQLGAEDIGMFVCEGDGPQVAAAHPQVRFSRTKTLMAGDDCCDHCFYVRQRVDEPDLETTQRFRLPPRNEA